MSAALRVLYVEDSEDDVQLLTQQLQLGGYHVTYERVVTADAFRAALHRGGWDCIVADYSLQRFSGIEAIDIALHIAPDTPLILVSGLLEEEIALECVRMGASDYVTKQNILRFLPVVARTLRDAGERRSMRRAEADLRQQRALLSLIYDNTSDSLLLQRWDPQTTAWRLISLNRAASAQLSAMGMPVTEHDVLGRTLEEIVALTIAPYADPTEIFQAFYRTAETGRTTTIEQTLMVRELRWHFELSLVFFHGPDGQTQYILTVVRDVTTRKQAVEQRLEYESRRAESQKMEALGQLAGGVAHDFNNILTAILGFSEVIQKTTPDALTHGHMTEIIRGARRAKELVRQILMFSRRQATERRPVPLGEIVREAVQLLRCSTPAHIEIVVHGSASGPWVLGDATQLHQVVMNLGTNSVQALGTTPGRIEYVLSADCQAVAKTAPNEYARLVVSDNGPGMEQAVLDRLFEPFFTTKAPGSGTGLGLSVVYGIVQNHQGVIDVRSQPGQGTTFEILLPCAPQPEPMEVTPMPQPTATTHGVRILFVDDESSIARLVQIMLKTMQHVPTVFEKSAEALAHFQNHAQAFDLVITDLTMPGMTGVELARGIRDVRQDIPIILSSGFPDEVTEETLRSLGIVEVLQKPFQMQTLAEAIHRHAGR